MRIVGRKLKMFSYIGGRMAMGDYEGLSGIGSAQERSLAVGGFSKLRVHRELFTSPAGVEGLPQKRHH